MRFPRLWVAAADQNTEKELPPDPDPAWKALGIVNDWIKHAEAKTVATLAAIGVSGGVLFNLTRDVANPSLPFTISASISAIGIVIGGICSLTALRPRLRLTRRKSDAARTDLFNPLFFHDVASSYETDGPSYVSVLHTLTTNKADLVRHLGFQVHANAIVAVRKYRWSNRAIHALSVNLIALGALAAIIALGW